MELGIVTYNIARDWDIETIIENCEAVGLAAVELRSTHAHGVEPGLSAGERHAAAQRFAASNVRLLSLGTACEYHSPDAEVVEANIAQTREFVELAADLGCLGVKVRPNTLPEGVAEETTLAQIADALKRCGEHAAEHEVEIWLEVHGRHTQEPQRIQRIMEQTDHPWVGVCWNSNDTDVVDGSVETNFRRLEPWIRNVHVTQLWREFYPWEELFALLRGSGYDRYCLAEIQASDDPLTVLRYYHALWKAQAGL